MVGFISERSRESDRKVPEDGKERRKSARHRMQDLVGMWSSTLYHLRERRESVPGPTMAQATGSLCIEVFPYVRVEDADAAGAAGGLRVKRQKSVPASER